MLLAADVQNRVETALGGPLDDPMQVHDVRLVAPNKRMLCLSFHVPPGVAFAADALASKDGSTGSNVQAPSAVDHESALQQNKRQRT